MEIQQQINNLEILNHQFEQAIKQVIRTKNPQDLAYAQSLKNQLKKDLDELKSNYFPKTFTTQEINHLKKVYSSVFKPLNGVHFSTFIKSGLVINHHLLAPPYPKSLLSQVALTYPPSRLATLRPQDRAYYLESENQNFSFFEFNIKMIQGTVADYCELAPFLQLNYAQKLIRTSSKSISGQDIGIVYSPILESNLTAKEACQLFEIKSEDSSAIFLPLVIPTTYNH